jgi:hypothetical protein
MRKQVASRRGARVKRAPDAACDAFGPEHVKETVSERISRPARFQRDYRIRRESRR